jgi:ABC-type multidrug transport system fused ATPase/permease subunit
MKNLLRFLIFDKSILPRKYRIFSLLLIFVILIGFFAELFSIGLIVPLMSAVFDESKILYYSKFFPNFINLNSMNKEDLILLFLSLTIIAYILKSLIVFFQNFFIGKYCLSVGLYIQGKMIKNYLNKSIDYYNNINSSIMIRNLATEVTIFTNHLLIPFFSMVSEFMVLIGLTLVILYVEFKIGIYIFLITALAIIILRAIFYKRLIRWGNERQQYSASSLQKINDLFFLNKEIKILKKENFFFNSLYLNFFRLARVQFKKRIIQPIPRLLGEILAVASFSILILSMLKENKSTSEMIVVLALFAACALRLIPSFNRITDYYNTFKYSLPSVDVLIKEIKPDSYNLTPNIESEKNKISNFENLIIKNLNFSYGKKKILNNLNLEINKNDVIGIIGQSGSGKTTLVNILLGFHKIDQEIIYNNKIISDTRDWLSRVGYVAQDTFLLDTSIKNNIAFGLPDEKIDESQILKVINDSQLTNTISELDKGINTIIGENGVRLSGGQKQRLGIARALYFNPEVLIFDEVTSSLDLNTEKEFLESIFNFKNKKTLLIVTHRPSLLKACNKIYKLDNGNLILND